MFRAGSLVCQGPVLTVATLPSTFWTITNVLSSPAFIIGACSTATKPELRVILPTLSLLRSRSARP